MLRLALAGFSHDAPVNKIATARQWLAKNKDFSLICSKDVCVCACACVPVHLYVHVCV